MKRFLKYLRNVTEVGIATARPAGKGVHGVVKMFFLIMILSVISGALMSMKVARARSAGGNEVWQCGGVNITQTNGNLSGVVQTADGVCGLVMTGVSEGGGYTVGTQILVTSMTDVTTAGITAANNPFAIKQLQEFYNQAGNGADLYVMLVPPTVTVAAMALNSNTTNGMGVLQNFADGKIKFMGIISDDLAMSGGIATAALHTGSPGTGYVAGDTGTITGGTNPATYTVSTVSGSAVATFAVSYPGEGYTVTTNVTTATGGAQPGVGTGFKVDISTLDSITVTNGVNVLVATAATNAAVTQAAFAAAEMPFRLLIGGTSYNGTASSTTDYGMSMVNNMCSIIIGDTSITYSSKGAAVGLFLGAKAALPAQRKNSRTRNGALTNSTAYLGSTLLATGNNDPVTLSNKHYITFTLYPLQSGIYFTTDWTLTASTDDYCYLVRGFVIDKARILAYAIYFQMIDDEIPSVPGTGLIDPGFAASLDTNIEDYLNENMTAFGNITGCTSFTTPTQNVVETDDVDTVIGIDAVGYAGTINIKLGFAL